MLEVLFSRPLSLCPKKYLRITMNSLTILKINLRHKFVPMPFVGNSLKQTPEASVDSSAAVVVKFCYLARQPPLPPYRGLDTTPLDGPHVQPQWSPCPLGHTAPHPRCRWWRSYEKRAWVWGMATRMGPGPSAGRCSWS